MMHVRHMGMQVPQPGMPMRVYMRFARRVVRQVLVPVMRIVHVSMRVLHRLMLMLMLVMLGKVQPDTNAHQETGCEKLDGQRLAKEQDGRDSAQERRG